MAVAAAVFTGEVDVALRSMVSVKHFGFLVFWYLVDVSSLCTFFKYGRIFYLCKYQQIFIVFLIFKTIIANFSVIFPFFHAMTCIYFLITRNDLYFSTKTLY